MKTYFETPKLKNIAFEAKDVLTVSPSIQGDHEELPGIPKN